MKLIQIKDRSNDFYANFSAQDNKDNSSQVRKRIWLVHKNRMRREPKQRIIIAGFLQLPGGCNGPKVKIV